MDFATWVQSQIEKFDITIYQISRRSGVHASTIANWLNGAKPQDAKAKAVKTALDEIIKEKQGLSSGVLPPEGAKKAPAAKGEDEAKLAQFVDGFMRLTPQQKDTVLALIKGFLQDQA